MKTIISKYKYIALLLITFCLFESSAIAQEKCNVKGNVTINGGDLSNVKVTLYKDSNKESVRNISKNGKFSYQLDFGYDYIFEFSKKDFVTKKVSVSTYVPQDVLERDSRFPPCKFSIELFRFFPGIDLSVFDQPIGMIMYNNETDLIETDLSFQTEIEDELKRIEKETRLKQEAYLANLARINAEFNAAIKKGDSEFLKKNYIDSKSFYTEASTLKPEEEYPISQIAKIDKLMIGQKDKLEAQRLLAEKKYTDLIATADIAFEAKQYENAKSKYTEALKVKADEAYPQSQIQIIEDKLDYLKQLAAANEQIVAQQKAIDAKYKKIIKLADSQFSKKDYDAAISSYNQALEVKSDETYPQTQIQIINDAIEREKNLLANKAKQKEINDQYKLLVSAGDKQLKNGDYIPAKQSYNDALTLKPNESYPKAQLVKIESLMAHQAKLLAEKEAKEKRYADLVSLADSQMNTGDFDKAMASYQQALNLKPKANYLKEQVKKAKQGKIDKKRKAEEKVKKELEQKLLLKKYDDLIVKGDNNLAAKKYYDSRDNYKRAIEIKPTEKYPKDQLNKLEELMAKELQQANAMKEFEARYEALITTGNSQLKLSEYLAAKKTFRNASEMKPEEIYPKEQLKKLDDLIAEENRIKADKKKLDEKYEILISKADSEFKVEDYTNAISNYQAALNLKPKETHPKDRIREANEILDEQNRLVEEKKNEEKAKQALDEKYSKAIMLADAAFSSESFKSATSNYKQALEYKNGDEYATSQIQKIKDLIIEKEALAKAADLSAKKKAILNKQFRSFVSEGDKLFKNEKYAEALGKYESAVQIMRNDAYALKQINLVKDRIAEEKLAKEEKTALLEKYEVHIKQGNKLFSEESWKAAKGEYLLALKIKSKEKYPKNQIAIIDETLAKKEKLDRKNSKVEKEFNEIVKLADSHFKKKSYTLARHKYRSAQKIKPDDVYVRSQLQEIKMILKANAQAKEENLLVQSTNAFGDNLLKIKEKEYKVFIELGDDAIKNKYLGKAKAYYKKAIKIFDRDYPREKLAEIEELRFAFKSEKERVEYERLMQKADEQFAKKNYSVARHYYKQALSVAADKTLVEDKLDDIENAFNKDKQRELDAEFDSIVEKGNKAKEAGNLSVAKFYYLKALKLKPKDSAVKASLENMKKELK